MWSLQKAALAVEALPFFEAEAAERMKAGQKHGGETAGRGRAKEAPDSSPQKVGKAIPITTSRKLSPKPRDYFTAAKLSN